MGNPYKEALNDVTVRPPKEQRIRNRDLQDVPKLMPAIQQELDETLRRNQAVRDLGAFTAETAFII